jgi:hypothetical protein
MTVGRERDQFRRVSANELRFAAAAAAWPLAARAQQAGKVPTIGFLGSTTPSAMSEWVAAFVQRLRELGWIEGRNIAVEYRWAEGRSERFTEVATLNAAVDQHHAGPGAPKHGTR